MKLARPAIDPAAELPKVSPASRRLRFATRCSARHWRQPARRSGVARGRAGDAEAVIRPVAAQLGREYPAGDPRIAAAEVPLARAMIAQGRVAEGRALLAKYLDAFAVDGTAHSDNVAAARCVLSAPPQPLKEN